MKNKKKILYTGIILIIIVVIILISIQTFKYFNNRSIFLKYLNVTTNEIIDKLKYDSISGNAKFKLNVKSNLQKENIIIDNASYNTSYQIDLNKGYINMDIEGNYSNEILKSNIYISDNNINILLNDIFNKYIVYDVDYLNLLTNSSDYIQIITILNEEINEMLEPKQFTRDNAELNNKKVTKITLDLTSHYSKELKEKLINKLSKNKKFMKSLSKINNNEYNDKELISKMNRVDMNDYKISLYFSKDSNEFIKLEVDSTEIDFNLENKNNKYYFEYYLRSGMLYNGYIKIKDNMVNEFNFINTLDNYCINLNFDELSIDYNKKIDGYKEVKIDNSITYKELTESDKNVIKNNDIINTIYNNYLNRYHHEVLPENDSTASEVMDPIYIE